MNKGSSRLGARNSWRLDIKMIACNHPDMSSLTVRNLAPSTKARLAQRAKRKGRSLEAEVRAILDSAAQEPANDQADFPDWFIAMIEPGEDVADFLETRRIPHPPVRL